MFIYNIDKPETPLFISEFQHGTACDPVVVDDNYAYITLRAGNFCGAFDSSLEIVDISDIYNLKLIKSYTMDNPYGLGIKDNLLFICDGTSGLKVYNKGNIEELELLNTFKDITAYDVIPMENNLLLIGENTLYQYTYSNNVSRQVFTYSGDKLITIESSYNGELYYKYVFTYNGDSLQEVIEYDYNEGVEEFVGSLYNAVDGLTSKYPGISVKKIGDKQWTLEIPEKYSVGHEAHFGQVTEQYLQYLIDGKLPDWEVPNMIVKYYTTTEGMKAAMK